MPPTRYQIPIETHATVLRKHFAGESARSIYLAEWPQGNGAPVTLVTFSNALRELVHRAEVVAERVGLLDAENEGSSYAGASTGSHALELAFPDEMESALAELWQVRRCLERQLQLCERDPLPDAPAKDSRALRATAVAALSNAIAANVAIELKATDLRTRRTVVLESLAPPPSRPAATAKTGSGFILDLGDDVPS